MAFFNLPFGIRISNNNPLDGDRYVASDITARDQLITDKRAYDGLQVFDSSSKKLWFLKDLSTNNWGELKDASSLSLNGSLNEIVISDGLGGNITDSNFTWDGSILNLADYHIYKNDTSSYIHELDGNNLLSFSTTTTSLRQYGSAGLINITSAGLYVNHDSHISLGGTFDSTNYITVKDPSSGTPKTNIFNILSPEGNTSYFKVNNNGTVYCPSINNISKDNVLYYDTSTGELTYSSASSISVDAWNGLTNTDGSIGLGGTLYQNTSIDSSNYNLDFNGPDFYSYGSLRFKDTYASTLFNFYSGHETNDNFWNITGNSTHIELRHSSDTNNLQILRVLDNQITFSSKTAGVDHNLSLGANALQYLSDYRNDYQDRSVIDKRYVDPNITEKNTGYILTYNDHNDVIDASGTFTLTLPDSVPIGMQCTIVNSGIGTITLDASNLLSAGGASTITTQYAGASVVHKGNGTWYAFGDLN